MAAYYGKIPRKGDFISRGLSRETVEKLHTFFSGGLDHSMEKLGDKWIEHYSIAPIWFFYLPPGAIGTSAYIGLWMASVDRVNRYFPMCALQSLAQPIATLQELDQYVPWFLEAETLLFDTLDSTLDENVTLSNIDELKLSEDRADDTNISMLLTTDHISAVTPPKPASEMERYLLQQVENLGREIIALNARITELTQVNLTNEADQTATVNIQTNTNYSLAHDSLATCDLADSYSHLSIWLSAGNEQISPQLFFSEQLPEAEEFDMFLCGVEK